MVSSVIESVSDILHVLQPPVAFEINKKCIYLARVHSCSLGPTIKAFSRCVNASLGKSIIVCQKKYRNKCNYIFTFTLHRICSEFFTCTVFNFLKPVKPKQALGRVFVNFSGFNESTFYDDNFTLFDRFLRKP